MPERLFDSGANRDTDLDKLDYEGFLHPMVLEAYAMYMHDHRQLSDGTMRSADNWQKGMPREEYMKSLLRHVMDLWMMHRGHMAIRHETGRPVEMYEALGGILFNAMGYWYQWLEGAEAEYVDWLAELEKPLDNPPDNGRVKATPLCEMDLDEPPAERAKRTSAQFYRVDATLAAAEGYDEQPK